MNRGTTIRHDLQAGLTVALVAIPQCMAFAAIAGLPPVAGIYSAVAMGLVGALIATCPQLNIGPAVTTSAMVYAVLATAAPDERQTWPALAGLLALLVGGLTVIAALLKVGQFVRFVSRSVLVGLVGGAAILIFGSQLAPFLGLPQTERPTLIHILIHTAGHLGDADPASLIMAAGTLVLVVLGSRVAPQFPTAFVALVLAGAAAWLLGRAGVATGLQTVGSIPRQWPTSLTPRFDGPYTTDLFVGAAALALVGVIQTLAIAKTLADRWDGRIEPRRELIALGAANVAASLAHGFPGAGSFARSALNDAAGARTRLSGVIASIAIVAVVSLAAPLAGYITKAAIAGLLMATAWSIVDWRELLHILRSRGDDRLVLVITLLCVFVMPIHWAILIGLALSVALFLRRVSQLHLVEMVAGQGQQFHERQIDERSGGGPITMLQVEGPLFFAHAEEMGDTLRGVFSHRPRVTIIRMRRTQQIDFSVVTAMERAAREYLQQGGTLILCGLTPEMRSTLRQSALGRIIPARHLLQTTGEVFGSAHRAIELAREIVAGEPGAPAAGLRRAETAERE
jgi:SulP family sulfate permease